MQKSFRNFATIQLKSGEKSVSNLTIKFVHEKALEIFGNRKLWFCAHEIYHREARAQAISQVEEKFFPILPKQLDEKFIRHETIKHVPISKSSVILILYKRAFFLANLLGTFVFSWRLLWGLKQPRYKRGLQHDQISPSRRCFFSYKQNLLHEVLIWAAKHSV